MKLSLIRHAESVDNLIGLLTGGAGDPVLSDRGIKQCHELNKVLKGLSFDLFLTSPTKRAKSTALLSGINREVLVENALIREKSFGIFEGRPVKEYEEVIKSLSMHDLYVFRPENGESFQDLTQRVNKFIKLLKDYDSQNILLFSHECFNRCLIATIKKIPFNDWLRIPQTNASFMEVQI